MTKFFTDDASVSRLAARIPTGAWDAHMHVVDLKTYPPTGPLTYTPSSHSIEQAKEFLGSVGIENMVIVQPSFYGNDNSCTLQGVKDLTLPHGRAVVQFDSATATNEDIAAFHAAGARGVRINLRSVGGKPSPEELKQLLGSYAKLIKPFDWVIQLYLSMDQIELLEPIVPELGVKICIDHIGHPINDVLANASSPADIPGFAAFLRLLEQGQTWVKLSGTYRLHNDPKNEIVGSLIKEILKVRTDRAVIATDWPHTRYDDLNVGPYFEHILDSAEAAGASLEQLMVTNTEVLFDAKKTS